MEYIRFSNNYTKNKLIPITSSPYDHIVDKSVPYFTSMMTYTQAQFDEWKKTRSLAGMNGGKTNKIWADFDCKENLEKAFADCEVFVNRLFDLGFNDDNVQITFSGGKGTGVIVENTQEFTIDQVKAFCTNLAKGLTTFDTSMYDHQRIFRLPFTVNEKTGLYKIPLTFEELVTKDIEQIKEYAKDISGYDKEKTLSYYTKSNVSIPKELFVLPEEPKIIAPLVAETEELRMSEKPKWLSNCRWALQNGFFKEGNRSNVMTCLAATYKNQGFSKDVAYRMLKGVAEVQSRRNGTERFPDKEMWNNVIATVFNTTWQGGQFSCRTEGWLRDYCNSMGSNKCTHDEDTKIFSDFTSITGTFKDFAVNLEHNIVKTGIEALDNEVTLTTSMLVGLLGAPSSGKTTGLAFSMLNHASLNGTESAFYSMDMGAPLVFMRMIQKHTQLGQDEIYHIYKTNPKEETKINTLLHENYKNVKFSFKCGMTVDDIRRSVVDHRINTGKPLKFIVVDYLESIAGPFSEANANVALISRQLKDLANEEKLLVLLLLQTQKHSGDPSYPLLSMRNIKGASTIEQDCSVVLSIYREGFSATNPENDKFITISAVKNRMGSLTSLDFGFDGLTGAVTNLSDEGYQDLKQLRYLKKEQKEKQSQGWGS